MTRRSPSSNAVPKVYGILEPFDKGLCQLVKWYRIPLMPCQVASDSFLMKRSGKHFIKHLQSKDHSVMMIQRRAEDALELF